MSSATLDNHRNSRRERLREHAAGTKKISNMFLGMNAIGQRQGKKRENPASRRAPAADYDLDSMLDELSADPTDRLSSSVAVDNMQPDVGSTYVKKRRVGRQVAPPVPQLPQDQGLDDVDIPMDDYSGDAGDMDDQEMEDIQSSSNSQEDAKAEAEEPSQVSESVSAAQRMAEAARRRKQKKIAAARAARAAAQAAAEAKMKKQLSSGTYSDLPSQDTGTGGWWDVCEKGNDVEGKENGPSVPSKPSNAVEELQNVLIETKDSDGDPVKVLRMFWLDIFEDPVGMPGRLFMFGKVWHPVRKKHISCMVTVRGHERQLFFLPRTQEGSEPDMMALYKEIEALLMGKIIPRGKKESFRCKPVERKYAFEKHGVPRTSTKYMKCKYSSVFPAIDPGTTGRNFSRVFGAKTSVLENFILKRKLRGPCWVDIRSPEKGRNQSWCQVEAEVLNPKDVIISEARHEDGSALPPPPLNIMSISLKTRADLRTQTNEVALVSLLTHENVEMDKPTEGAMHRKNVTVFSAIRSIGGSGELGSLPTDYKDNLRKRPGLNMTVHVNEKAMLNWLMARIHLSDPDVIVGHSITNFELDILMTRMAKFKIPHWSKLGRLRRSKNPYARNSDHRFARAAAGRLVCDTYITSKELLLRESNYRLGTLAKKFCDGANHSRVNPVDVPLYYRSTDYLIRLQRHTENTAFLSMKLMFKLEMIPLTKQLTNIGGNLWQRTLSGGRAERIEYLLLHAFHRKKYIVPDKERGKKSSGRRGKPKYAGGLVLEPKKGLYDKFTLLLDFNSLYPSIIQEYNLCYTTVQRDLQDAAGNIVRADPSGESESSGNQSEEINIPNLPDRAQFSEPGVLPTLIKYLVDKRSVLKVALKKEQDPVKKKMIDVRQKALKITANSMYGCLGFSNSRFYAAPIAALVTSTGREILQRTVDMANGMGYNVIYGDTDSIMVYTGLTDLDEVEKIGRKIKAEVNKLYNLLEIEIDGVYKSMLLLKKKKYAALSVVKDPEGKYHVEKETKGLDLVRRDWCGLSKEIGHFVLDEVLSGKGCDEVVHAIHEELRSYAEKLRAGKVSLEQLVITKGLNKAPKDYPDAKGMAHLKVALEMVKAGKPVNVGDHIPYVICEQGGKSAAERAYHPDQVKQAMAKAPEGTAPTLSIDIEWYLAQQILPPTARLCDPIEGTSHTAIADYLGLDTKKYGHNTYSALDGLEDEDMVGFKPTSEMTDEERYKDVDPFLVVCPNCSEEVEFKGLYCMPESGEDLSIKSGLNCSNCGADWKVSHLQNNVDITMNKLLRDYYAGEVVCSDPTCQNRTRQMPVNGPICIIGTCDSQMYETTSATKVFTQMKYMEMLFNTKKWDSKIKSTPKSYSLVSSPTEEQREACNKCHKLVQNYISKSRYNWVSKDIWRKVWGGNKRVMA